jgi:hypothetical protein
MIGISDISPVFYASGYTRCQLQAVVGLPDQEQPRIRGDLPSLEIYGQSSLPKE